MTAEDIERLGQFLGGYFHQDWRMDAADPDGIIARFIAEHPDKQELASLAALVDSYAAAHDDSKLKQPQFTELGWALFTELGCYYVPPEEGKSREWLHQVADRLRAAAEE